MNRALPSLHGGRFEVTLYSPFNINEEIMKRTYYSSISIICNASQEFTLLKIQIIINIEIWDVNNRRPIYTYNEDDFRFQFNFC